MTTRTNSMRMAIFERVTVLGFLMLLNCGAETLADDPLPCQARVVLFIPAGSSIPSGYQERIDETIAYTEAFFQRELERWGHADTTRPFRRSTDGHVEVTIIHGQKAADQYKPVEVRAEVMDAARQNGEMEQGKMVRWIFVYAGDPPKRFQNYLGGVGVEIGGWAVCNFDTSPGKIDVKQPLGSTYLEEITLKGMIHELGHGFHLPHIGPLMGDDLGNTLMGPTHFNYKRQFPAGTQHVYLCEAEAAILSVHPAFNGVADSRKGLPKVQVDNLRYSTEPAKRQITVKGRLRSPAAARYALVTDQSDASPGEYWIRTYAGKIQTDGSFEVVLTEPADAGGTLRTWFVFENGALTGNGKSQGIESGIPQVYTFGRRGWEFKTNAQ